MTLSEPNGGGSYSGQSASISGADSGFLTKTYRCNQDGASGCEAYDISTWTAGEDICVPSTKDCKELDAIEFEDATFPMGKGSVDELGDDAPAVWIENLTKPLDFDEVTSTFAQYPK